MKLLVLISLVLYTQHLSALRSSPCLAKPLQPWQESIQLIDSVLFNETNAIVPDQRTSAIYGHDNRISANRSAYPYSAFGELKVNYAIVDEEGNVHGHTTGMCTGELVGSCHILTASHCLADLPLHCKEGLSLQFKSATFKGSDNKDYPIRFVKRLNDGSGGSRDVAFAQTSGQPGKVNGALSVWAHSVFNIMVGQDVEQVGFSGDVYKEKNLTTDQTGKIISADSSKGIFYIRSDSFGGSSGGAYLTYRNGSPQIVAVNSMGVSIVHSETCKKEQVILPGNERERERLNIAVSSRSFLPSLRQFLEEKSCSD